jgi:hypothetical protein
MATGWNGYHAGYGSDPFHIRRYTVLSQSGFSTQDGSSVAGAFLSAGTAWEMGCRRLPSALDVRRARRASHRGLRHLNLQIFLRESTWGYPIIAAIHVLGIAWFGGTILVSEFVPELRKLRHVGIALLLASGGVLFWLQPAQYYTSIAFWVKMILLVALVWLRAGTVLSLVIWAAIIFASRGIAFI